MTQPSNSSARDHILRLVCGFSKPKRDRRLLMVLKAFIDESIADNDVFILAGYIASAEKWADFSDDWQELLDMSPKWEFLHIRDIMGSRDPERIERAGWFYRVIEKYVSHLVCVAVPIEPLRKVAKEMHLPKLYERPFNLAFSALISQLGASQGEMNLNEPVDFIFDERSDFSYNNMDWHRFKSTVRDDFQQYLGTMPIFQDDKKVLPIQAADLIAWFMRKMWLKHRTIHGTKIDMPWPAKPKIPIPALLVEYNEELIRREAAEHLKYFT